MHVLAYCMTLVVTIINADEELYFKIALTLIFYSGLGTHCFVMEGIDLRGSSFYTKSICF
jgi:hypothetical protein